MFEHGISNRWLQHASAAIYVFFGSFALLGLGYVWYAASGGQVLNALIGAGIAFGAIGMGIAMHCIVQLAGVVAAGQRILEDLCKRADAMETMLEATGGLTNLSALGAGDPSVLTAGHVDTSGFPRLMPDSAAHASGLVGDARFAVEQPLQVAVNRTAVAVSDHDDAPAESMSSDQLRRVFRDSVYSGDYDSALEVGAAILDEYPASEMATQFRRLRPILENRLPRSH